MNESERQRQERSISTVLAALGEAGVPPGMETRILQRLRTEPLPARRPGWLGFPAVLAPVALLAVAVCAVTLHRQQPTANGAAAAAAGARSASTGKPVPQTSRIGMRRPDDKPRTGTASEAKLGSAPATRPAVLATAAQSSAGIARPVALEASFPAPEMPLTEQERLLLKIAHRNDPVEVAMLDPAEHRLALLRERAEVRRFFTPPPLPPEVQQQVDAAIRSQYVNTPPPDTRATDRSLP